MKIPDTDIDVRTNEPPEKIEMTAHSGECRRCGGVVKMIRDMTTAELQPNNCRCLMCGQGYFVEINGSIEEWEAEQ